MSEIVKPIEVNNIEFYVSKDGKQTGVSQTGLARLVGFNEWSARSLLTEIQRLVDRDNPESINEITVASVPIQNAALAISNGYSSPVFLEINAVKNAKVVHAKLVARIIRYYARIVLFICMVPILVTRSSQSAPKS